MRINKLITQLMLNFQSQILLMSQIERLHRNDKLNVKL